MLSGILFIMLRVISIIMLSNILFIMLGVPFYLLCSEWHFIYYAQSGRSTRSVSVYIPQVLTWCVYFALYVIYSLVFFFISFSVVVAISLITAYIFRDPWISPQWVMNSPFSVGTCQSLQSLFFYNGGAKKNFGTEKIQNCKKKNDLDLKIQYFKLFKF